VRLAGRWRYDRTAARGIALSYERSASVPPLARRPDAHAAGRFMGRWRYNHAAESGIALSYDGGTDAPLPAMPSPPEPSSPPLTHSPVVRVLCYCGDLFTFDGDGGVCPGCGRPAEWPTMGKVEREMRSDLDELFRDHERGAGSD
jgi:hypothetical protein